MRLVLAALLTMLIVAPLASQERPKGINEARQRINKKWDEQIARMQRARIEADCKTQAAQAYSAIRFNKRRAFVEECITKAAIPAATPASHQVY